MNWRLDEGYQEFIAAYLQARGDTMDDEYAEAYYAWSRLDFEQRAQAIAGIVARLESGRWKPFEPQYIMPPARYLQSEWKRKIAAPVARQSKADAKLDEAMRLMGGRRAG